MASALPPLLVLSLGLLTVAAAARAQATYRVGGAEAWEVARAAGFEFYPVAAGDRFILSGERDGERTSLKACGDPRASCEPEARIERGRLLVVEPRCPGGGCRRAHTFELFGGRPLAAGWAVARIEVEGREWHWVRRPRYGTREAGFALRVSARPGAAGLAAVRAITLEGPAGSDWREAFGEPGESRRVESP